MPPRESNPAPARIRSAAFIGNMNAMPMTYALALRAAGWKVEYFVDTPRSDLLSRPEYKFPHLGYPYPGWVIERRVRSPSMAALLPRFVFRDIVKVLRRADVVFASGLFLPFVRFLPPEQPVIFVSHGSDLEGWSDEQNIEQLAGVFTPRMGRMLAVWFVRQVVRRMVAGLRRASAIVTFPPGLSPYADQVLARALAGAKMRRIPRYDISFADLPDAPRPEPPPVLLRIVCGTRHTFRAHSGISEIENKGTDLIIRGLGRYNRSQGKAFEVHFFEKGRDIDEAKRLCREEGIDSFVVWHSELPFHEYVELHKSCHIAIDQLGSHWIGTGMYAMYMGMPLIANSRRDVLEGFWGEQSPICHAESADDVAAWLHTLEDPPTREKIGEASRCFAIRHFADTHTASAILNFIENL